MKTTYFIIAILGCLISNAKTNSMTRLSQIFIANIPLVDSIAKNHIHLNSIGHSKYIPLLDQLRDHPEGIHIKCKKTRRTGGLAQINETELMTEQALKARIDSEIENMELPYTKMFLKYQKQQNVNEKHFSTIPKGEFMQMKEILSHTIDQMRINNHISFEDYHYLTQLIDHQLMKKKYNSGSPIIAIALKLNNFKL